MAEAAEGLIPEPDVFGNYGNISFLNKIFDHAFVEEGLMYICDI